MSWLDEFTESFQAAVIAFLIGLLIVAVWMTASVFFASVGLTAERGIASIYFRGRYTASGERFDPRAMTAAHRTLRLGSKVMVRYGSRSVTVLINDRGPFVRHRIIDLTPAAARRLGIGGLALVTVEIAR